jgi:hypothetical protein
VRNTLTEITFSALNHGVFGILNFELSSPTADAL